MHKMRRFVLLAESQAWRGSPRPASRKVEHFSLVLPGTTTVCPFTGKTHEIGIRIGHASPLLRSLGRSAFGYRSTNCRPVSHFRWAFSLSWRDSHRCGSMSVPAPAAHRTFEPRNRYQTRDRPIRLFPYLWMLCGSLAFAVMGTVAHGARLLLRLAGDRPGPLFSAPGLRCRPCRERGCEASRLEAAHAVDCAASPAGLSMMGTFFALTRLPVVRRVHAHQYVPDLGGTPLPGRSSGRRPSGRVWLAVRVRGVRGHSDPAAAHRGGQLRGAHRPGQFRWSTGVCHDRSAPAPRHRRARHRRSLFRVSPLVFLHRLFSSCSTANVPIGEGLGRAISPAAAHHRRPRRTIGQIFLTKALRRRTADQGVSGRVDADRLRDDLRHPPL